MPLYFGFPLSVEETIRIININNLINDAVKKYYESSNNRRSNLDIDYFKLLEVRKYLEKNSNLKLYSTDKGQYILGYEIESCCDVWNNFVDVDNFIETLRQLTIKFENDLSFLNSNTSEVVFERMENDSIIMRHPKPCVIQWN